MGNKTDPREEREQRTIRAKGAKDHVPEPTCISNIPQVFTVWRERDLAERIPVTSADVGVDAEHGSSVEGDSGQQEMDQSTYGVHSLAETIALESGDEDGDDGEHNLRTTADSGVSSTPSSSNLAIGKRRRPGNPVHPKILATGQRIISSEHSPAPKSRPQQARTATAIPSLKERMRTMSIDSTHQEFSQQSSSLILTPETPSGSAARAGSPRSLRLSDDESLTFDDSASQAVFSSSGEEDEEVEKHLEPTDSDDAAGIAGPQFVMPSLQLPTRRPFTERGSQIGSFRILVTGRKDIGKSSLIQGLLDTCQDIVHHQGARVLPGGEGNSSTVVETAASTKAMPKWKTATLEESTPRAMRSSRSDNVLLERNISILECDAEEASGGSVLGANVLSLVESQCRSALAVEQMDSIRLAALLTGESRHVIDVILYIVKDESSTDEAALINKLSSLTNVVLVSGSDSSGSLQSTLHKMEAACVRLTGGEGMVEVHNRALNLSHLLQNNGKGSVEDSNTLSFVDKLFSPATVKQLRHLAARKLVKWYKATDNTFKSAMSPEESHILSAASTERVPHANTMEASMTCSTISSPSGVLVPYPDSSFYRPDSPTLSAHTIDSTSRIPSGLELATLQHHDRDQSPIREVRLAQWALDLQRSLQAEHNRQHRRVLSAVQPSSSQGEGTVARIDAVTPSSSRRRSPAKSSSSLLRSSALHGPDAADPLGIVRLGSRLRRDGLPMALRMAGVGAALATIVLACVRSWDTIRDWWVPGAPAAAVGRGHGEYYLGTGGGNGIVEVWDGVVGQVREWLKGW